MAWLFRTQPPERAKLIVLGYLDGRRDAFELAAARMAATTQPKSHHTRGLIRARTRFGSSGRQLQS